MTIQVSKDIFKLFSPSGSHTIPVFNTKPFGNIPTPPIYGATIAIFDQYLALASITAGSSGPSRVVNISTVEYRL